MRDVNIPGGYINTTLTFNPESNVNYTLQCWVYFSDGHVPSTTATITTKCNGFSFLTHLFIFFRGGGGGGGGDYH